MNHDAECFLDSENNSYTFPLFSVDNTEMKRLGHSFFQEY